MVEDEMLISLLIEDLLTDEECVLVGPYDQVPAALKAAQNLPIDAAVLDVNVNGVEALRSPMRWRSAASRSCC